MGVFAGRRDAAWAARVLFCLTLVFGLTIVVATPAPVWARQDETEKSATESGENKAADAAASTPAAPRQNLLKHMVVSAGIFFGPLLLLVSIFLVTLIVLLAMDLRMPVAIPPAFVDEFTDTVNKRRFREAFDLARGDSSFLGRVLTAGMGRLQYGIEDARETAFHTVDSVRASKDQLITFLATIGSLGPMLGLVGTVYGMIKSFMVLAQPGKTPNPQELAEGISHALVVTLLGVVLAVPAIFCHALFKNRLTRISMDTATVADDLLTQMYHNSKKAVPTSTEVRIATSTAVKPVEG